MAAPDSYTEETLAVFMEKVIGPVADALGWSVAGGDFEEPVNAALLDYGTDDISTVSGMPAVRALRALAKVAVWRAVVDATALDIDFQADGGQYSRSQIREHALESLALAELDAAPYSASYRISVDSVTYTNDPYRRPRPEDLEE